MTILLLDTYSLFFRAHHALPPMSTTRGEPTGALYGLSVLLLKLLREQSPDGLALALDSAEPTFRVQEYEDYKAHRERAAGPLVSQFRRLDQLIAALGVPAHAAPGFEADDILATLVDKIGPDALVVSGDRDLLQLAQNGARILFVGARGQKHRMYDRAAVEERFGIAPEQLPSYVALVGDPSDNLPKVPGIGARGAQRLIARWGDIDGLLAHLSEIPLKLRDVLAAHADQARRCEALARLRTDVQLAGGPLHAPLPSEASARLRELFTELEFKSLLPRLPSS